MTPEEMGLLPAPTVDTRTIAHLKERLVQIGKTANDYGGQHGPETSWDELKGMISDYLEQGEQARDLETSTIGMQAISQSGADAHLMAPTIAIAYSLEGLEALRRGNLAQATACAERGSRYLSSDMLIDQPGAKLIEGRKIGGNTTAQRFLPAKKMAAQLLSSEMPEGGWPDVDIAINAVYDILREDHWKMVESCGLRTENLPRTIRRWVKEAPEKFVITVRQK